LHRQLPSHLPLSFLDAYLIILRLTPANLADNFTGSGFRSCGLSDGGNYSKYGMLQWSAAGNSYNLTAFGGTLRSPMIQFTTAFDDELQLLILRT
jgi:hypothetical protein